MKTWKQGFIGLLVIFALLLAFTTCKDEPDPTHTHTWEWVVTTPASYDTDGIETETCSCGATNGTRTIARIPFTSNTALSEWLSSQSPNSADDPYIVKLKTNDISGIREILNGAADKYVYLDLSESTIEEIPDRIFNGTESPYGTDTLTGITLPNSVTSIGERAFFRCSSLTSVTIPNSVTSIGNSTFVGCTSLTSINIPNNVTSIGNSTFNTCSSLTSIIIPNSVTSIGDYAFFICASLTSITIPNNVTSIGEGAFYNCTSLTSVTFNGTITVDNFEAGSTYPTFPGDLRDKYLTIGGGIGTYTTTAPVNNDSVWTKQ